MTQAHEITKHFDIVFEGNLAIEADRMEDDGETLTFWDELGVLVAKIPLTAVYAYEAKEVEAVS